jgi:tetratricopeptide (TPR) repeat protein
MNLIVPVPYWIPRMKHKDFVEQIELLIETGDIPGALELCNLSLLEFPDEPTFLCLMGIAYQQIGELSKALFYHTKCVAIEPNYFICWSCISIIHLEMLEMEKAHHSILRTLRTGPNQAEAWWLRAIFRELHGDIAGGERAYQHASWLNPVLIPPLSPFNELEINTLILSVCDTHLIDIEEFSKNIRIIYTPTPDIILLQESDIWESPIHILFSFTRTPDKATITCYKQNIRRSIAENEDIPKYLSNVIIPQVQDYLKNLEADC